ncbi:MAG: hypothetical protein QME63_04325 [Actinomycetota bacterium]|nr:hypothetical protein [Actinomycetota bacterium]
MPYLEDWHEKYHDKGFTLIGVHTPEFDFERDPENVRWVVNHYGLKYPIVLDNHYRIWHAYANAYWPRKYMVLNGKIVYDHIGEGAYQDTEIQLRALLQDINPELDLSNIPLVKEKKAICQPPSEELYCGYSRGIINNPGGFHKMEEFFYDDPGIYSRHGLYLQGRWRADRQYLEHVGTNKSDYLVVPFKAVSVNLVMMPRTPEPIRFSLEFNDKPLDDSTRGDDVTDSEVTVKEPRLYNIFRADRFVSGVLKLKGLPNGLKLYAFTFGGCIGII